MDNADIKKTVMDIRLTEEASERIINDCHSIIKAKKQKPKPVLRRVIVVAAVLAALSVSAVASVKSGNFKDVFGWNGAITGTIYENATEEISVTAAIEEGKLIISVKTEDKAPYIYFEELGISDMVIEDEGGKEVLNADGIITDISEGRAVFKIDTDNVEIGNCKIIIKEFTGYKKADQPLPVKGFWETDIVI
ncbi:MAG: hypothetical protein E7235_02650 [Lachnospiraceae bacterium]|nr:hypothetical protein [Lachnospiraceae bacterium]